MRDVLAYPARVWLCGRQGAPKVLDGVEWNMQVVMGESQLREAKDTAALFDFTLAEPDVVQDANVCGWARCN